MIRAQLFGIRLFCILSLQIGCTSPVSYYSKVKKVNVADHNKYFPEYCKIDSSNNYQKNFTLCSFFGDYKGALNFATKDAILRKQNRRTSDLSPEELEIVNQELQRLVIDSAGNSAEPNAMAQILRSVIEGNRDVKEVFKDKTPVNAKEYIVSNSSKYHFLLLNEAHYSSQNRAFTKDLLRPLWEKGYRYLALETLDYTDTKLMQRGYPIMSTGYYTKESVFGNLVREALLIGYKLIPYESKNLPLDLSVRDGEQAQNIYNATLKIDSIGKVIIHAGYSHISEFPGVEYKAMGFQLGQLVSQPIFTIDQVDMTELYDEGVMHSYYKYALATFNFNEPVVLVNNTGIPQVDPPGIDVQVYHPRTSYIRGRPSWLLEDGNKLYDLSPEILSFKGSLIQAIIQNEDPLSVPVDQIIIKEDHALILKPGNNYSLRIIDCNGSLIGEATLKTH